MISNLKFSALSLCVAASIGVAMSAPAKVESQAAVTPVSASDLIYTPQEMLSFDIDRYLAKRAPHLRSKSEVISHWAAYSGISPKVLIALMEQQSGVVTRTRMRGNPMARPFGNLSRKNGFDQQVKDIAGQLEAVVYAQRDTQIAAKARGNAIDAVNPLQAFYEVAGESRSKAAMLGQMQFAETYGGLFNETWGAKAKSSIAGARFVATALPTTTVSLPYAVGTTMKVEGAHSTNNASLDFITEVPWGSSQSSYPIKASTSGTFKRHSSCYAEVIHSSGWSTSYYHIDRIALADGSSVSSGTTIAYPAKTTSQALCDGGSADSPHLHWTLRNNGVKSSVNGLRLSNYLVTATSSVEYYRGCDKFSLYHVVRKVKYCGEASSGRRVPNN
jgi:murein DD-endopeptidase MepM/ murein hydrolase activator NlpD